MNNAFKAQRAGNALTSHFHTPRGTKPASCRYYARDFNGCGQEVCLRTQLLKTQFPLEHSNAMFLPRI